MLHVKLGVIKNLVEPMDQIRVGFMYLCIPRINDAKIEEGVFVAAQIMKLIHDIKFEDRLTEVEKQNGNHPKSHYQYFWEIKKLKTSVIW